MQILWSTLSFQHDALLFNLQDLKDIDRQLAQFQDFLPSMQLLLVTTTTITLIPNPSRILNKLTNPFLLQVLTQRMLFLKDRTWLRWIGLRRRISWLMGINSRLLLCRSATGRREKFGKRTPDFGEVSSSKHQKGKKYFIRGTLHTAKYSDR